MSNLITIESTTINKVLNYLKCTAVRVDLPSLNRLVFAYTRSVPWESISRIVKRRNTPVLSQCPRLPEEFWRDALLRGTGGTCFESNLAFFALLKSLGYDGYLTINDMDEYRAVHTAIIIRINKRKYVVDVGMPLNCAIPFTRNASTRRYTEFHTYVIQHSNGNVYQIKRTSHPRPYCFTLLDVPVPLTVYYTALERDYSETGLFLDRAIITKIVGDVVCRYNSDFDMPGIEMMNRKGRTFEYLNSSDIARKISDHFSIDYSLLRNALDISRFLQK